MTKWKLQQHASVFGHKSKESKEHIYQSWSIELRRQSDNECEWLGCTKHDSEGRGCLIGGDYGSRGGHLKQLAKQWLEPLFKYEIKQHTLHLDTFTCKFSKCTTCSIRTWTSQTLFTKIGVFKMCKFTILLKKTILLYYIIRTQNTAFS